MRLGFKSRLFEVASIDVLEKGVYVIYKYLYIYTCDLIVIYSYIYINISIYTSNYLKEVRDLSIGDN